MGGGVPREKSRFRETMLVLFSIVGFPPFGFVLKPVGSIDVVLGELQRNCVRDSRELIPLLELIRRRLTPQLIHDVTN